MIVLGLSGFGICGHINGSSPRSVIHSSFCRGRQRSVCSPAAVTRPEPADLCPVSYHVSDIQMEPANHAKDAIVIVVPYFSCWCD